MVFGHLSGASRARAEHLIQLKEEVEAQVARYPGRATFARIPRERSGRRRRRSHVVPSGPLPRSSDDRVRLVTSYFRAVVKKPAAQWETSSSRSSSSPAGIGEPGRAPGVMGPSLRQAGGAGSRIWCRRATAYRLARKTEPRDDPSGQLDSSAGRRRYCRRECGDRAGPTLERDRGDVVRARRHRGRVAGPRDAGVQDRDAARAGARSWTPRPARSCSTRCCSRTPAARRTRPGWRRCSAPTITSPSAPPSASTGRGVCPRSCGRCVRSRRAARSATRLDRLLAIKAEGEVTRALMQARCDRGAEIALMLGLGVETAEAIRALDEHWDGGGPPRGLRARGDPAAGADPLPRADGRDLPRRGRRPGGLARGPPAPRAAGSIRRWWTRSGRSSLDADFWALAARGRRRRSGSLQDRC